MEISICSLLSGLQSGEGLGSQCNSKGQNTSNGHGQGFHFTDPAFTSAQLKEKWAGGFNGVMFGNGGMGGPKGHGGQCRGGMLNNQGAPRGGYCGTASSAMSQLNQTEAHTEMKKGRVHFENENYNISISDRGEIKVNNKNTGEKYRIWGDPHVDVDGKRAFDFKGDTTFVMDDGTKISIETTPWKGGKNGETIASKVSIIDGNSSYGLHVTGVDDNHRGDLAFEEVPNFGHFLDAMVDDGHYVHENPVGKGFIAVGKDGWAEVDQSVMDFIENGPGHLGFGSGMGAGMGGGMDGHSPLGGPLSDFMNGDSVSSSLADLMSFLDSYQSQDQQNSMLESLLSIFESLLSLVMQQARPFGYMSGLSGIQTQGSYQMANMNNPFSFNLNFFRA